MGQYLDDVDLGNDFIPTKVAVGTAFTCAVSSTNTAKCWGSNINGGLGYGDTNHRGDQDGEMGTNLTEIDLGQEFKVMDITVGDYSTCALSTNHTLKCWGRNTEGELGLGDTDYRGNGPNEMGANLPTVDLGSNFVPMQVSAGRFFVCALSTTNTAKCWGRNQYGNLGYGDTNNRGDEPGEMADNLEELDFGLNFIPMSITTGGYHACALSSNNTVKCWGWNSYGELGHEDVVERHFANGTEIDLGPEFITVHIAAGSSHTCATAANETVKCWGRGSSGRLGYEDTNDRGKMEGDMGSHLSRLFFGSFPPSQSPTPHPTLYPTLAPTTPTVSPTLYPTTAPTLCIDYDYGTNVSSNDGSNEMQFDWNLVNISHYLQSDADTDYFNATVRDEEDIKCNSIHCLIECNDIASCLLKNITAANTNSGTMNIFCLEPYSCLSVTVSSSAASSVVISCIGKDSCIGMQVSARYFESFNVYCVEEGACSDMEVNIVLNSSDTNRDNDGIIHCVIENSCNNLKVTTASQKTQLLMHQHSDNVVLDNNIGYLSAENNIDCNRNRYITFRGDETETSESVTESILNEYNDGLPCSDVHVLCGNASCTMAYSINSIELESLNEESTYNGCYWLNMQRIQNIFCEGGCQQSPTKSPTSAPTSSPTQPTSEPSASPSNAPSTAPTMNPSQPPSASPSQPPSVSPTNAPTYSPTNSPTVSPSVSPTVSPTRNPTRFPTASDLYDYWIDVVYQIEGYSEKNIFFILNDSVSFAKDIQEILERNYFISDDVLSHRNFEADITKINGVDFKEEELTFDDMKSYAFEDPITLQSIVWVDSIERGGSIITKSASDAFSDQMERDLVSYFNISGIRFTVVEDDKLRVNDGNDGETAVDMTIIILSIVIVAIGLCVGFAAFIYNKKDDSEVDDASFLSPILVGLQVYDLISDINLVADIFSHEKTTFDLANIMFWCGISAFSFTVIPYFSNIYYAITISQQKVIQRNTAAFAFFQSRLAQFLLLVVSTGGCFPSLSLVSSRIFALESFNSGLSKYELSRLIKIKVRSTITLENGPQLLTQVVYTMSSGGKPSSATIMAFSASLLSIIATLATYYAESTVNKGEDSTAVLYSLYFGLANKTSNLSQDETKSIMRRKERKKELNRAICSQLRIPFESLEIGFVKIVSNGCIINIVHHVFSAQLKEAKAKRTLVAQLHGFSVSINPQYYTRDLCEKHVQSLKDIFCAHFSFNDPDKRFIVKYCNYDDTDDVDDRDDGRQKLSMHQQMQLVPPEGNGPTATKMEKVISLSSDEEVIDSHETNRDNDDKQGVEMVAFGRADNVVGDRSTGRDPQLWKAIQSIQAMVERMQSNINESIQSNQSNNQSTQVMMEDMQRKIDRLDRRNVPLQGVDK